MAKSKARRSGILHTFDDPTDRARYLAASRRSGPVPMEIQDSDGSVIAAGQMTGAYLKGNDLHGDIRWPRKATQGRAIGQPTAFPEFAEDGSIARLVLKIDSPCDCEDGENCECHESEEKLESSSRNKAMPKNEKDVEAIFDNLVSKYDGDPTRLAYALIRLNQKSKAKQGELESKSIPADHVAVSTADSEWIEIAKSLGGQPKQVKKIVESLKALGDTPDAIDEAIQRGRDAIRGLSARDREAELNEVAEKMGYVGTGLKVFKNLVKDGMKFEPRKVRDEKTRKEIETYRVRYQDGDKEIVKDIADLESDENGWAPYLSALRPVVERPQTIRINSTTGLRSEGRPALAAQALGGQRNTEEPSAEVKTRRTLTRGGLFL